jgi:hypothetical protein
VNVDDFCVQFAKLQFQIRLKCHDAHFSPITNSYSNILVISWEKSRAMDMALTKNKSKIERLS